MSEGGSEARFLCSELGVFPQWRFFPPARPRDESKVAPKKRVRSGFPDFLGRAHKAVKEGPWVPD